MTMDIDMEDHRENEAKTKVVDNQGGTSAAAASEYIDLREKNQETSQVYQTLS